MSVCVESIRAAYGDEKLSEAQIRELQSDLRRRARELAARDPALGENDALAAAGMEFASQAERRALVQKRNTMLGIRARLAAIGKIETNFADDYAAGLKSILVGVQSAREGARWSAANEQLTLHNQYQSGLMYDIAQTEGALDVFSSGTMDLDVAKVLWALDTPGAKLDGFDVRAVAIGKAIRKWQEASRVNANRAGAWIGKLPGYIVTQSHDSLRIAKDRDAWMSMMKERADLPRMMSEQGADDVDKLLYGIWSNIASGLHNKVLPAGEIVGKGLRGMAKGVSQERVIHFKSADDWFAYNEQFGGGNLREAVLGGLSKMARATGLMRVLGPNHQDSYQRIVAELVSRVKSKDPKAAGALKSQADRMEKTMLQEIDGSLDIPGSNPMAHYSQSVRALQNMSSLGGSFLSSVGDLGVMMAGAKYAGRNGFGLVADGVGRLFSSAPPAERLGLYADLGLALESMASKFSTNRFSVDDGVRGAMGTAQKLFFKYNLQNRWTDSMRMAIAEFLSSNLARRAGDAFGVLDEKLRRTLTLYGIDEGRWDIMRSAGLDEVEGRQFLVPSAMRDVEDSQLSAYLKKVGKQDSASARAALREEIEQQFRAYFVDQNGYMLLTPDAATRATMKQGLQAGTAAGEAVRFIMQFKSFMIAYSQRVIGREIKQEGLGGVARLLAFSTLAGYAAMTLKDLARGKQPRDPSDPRTALAAFTQGGGLGIYSDILFSQVTDRRGTDAMVQLLGPTASDANEVLKILSRISEGKDPTAAGVRFVQSNLPFMNLFYAKLALDYLIFWNLQEAVNPGSLARTEREMEKYHGQQYIISPSRDRFQPERPQ